MGDKSELRLTLDGTPSSPASDLARTEGVSDEMEALNLVNVRIQRAEMRWCYCEE